MFLYAIVCIYISFFGTNLLTQCLVPVAVFCLFFGFSEKKYQMKSKCHETFWRFFAGQKKPWKLRKEARSLTEASQGNKALPGGRAVGVKTGRPRGRGSRAVDLGSMVTETMETVFTQVRALSMEVKPYVLLLLY